MNRRKQNALTVKQAIAELEKIPKRGRQVHYSEIWQALNEFSWDKRLGKAPANWDITPSYIQRISFVPHPRSRYAVTAPIMRYIEQHIGTPLSLPGMDKIIEAVERITL